MLKKLTLCAAMALVIPCQVALAQDFPNRAVRIVVPWPPSDWVELEPRLRRCPVPLVFDHMGRARGAEGVDSPGFAVIRRLLSERDDCWTKISSWYRLSDSGPPDYADMKPLVQTLLAERPERCVWGSNWPHPGLTRFMPNDTDLLDQLESWLPRDALREPLFARNAAKLYRLEDM